MAARKRGGKKTSSGRGSKEAIAKRRAARKLNTLITGGSKTHDKLDGRTEKRRLRLVRELKDGRKGKPLKPIDFVHHVNELIGLGETVASLKKQGVKPRKTEVTLDVMEAIETTQKAYEFHPDAWLLLGVEIKGDTATRKKPRTKRR